MNLKKTAILCAIVGTSVANLTAYAKANINISSDFFNAGNIELQLQAEEWVNTNAALVTISADATLDKNNDFMQTRAQLLQKFSELAGNNNGSITWNITTFNTSQSDSGLEQIHVEAQARLSENKLLTLRTKTKEMSKPGLTLRLLSIDFSPSLDELEKAKAQLRAVIYNEAKSEAARINKVYPEQKYVLRSISFQPTATPPIPLAINAMAMTSQNAVMGDARGAEGGGKAGEKTAVLAVSTKMQVTAIAEFYPSAAIVTSPPPQPTAK